MINIIGLGYIGLPTALMFAAHGNEVVGTDYNVSLVETLNAGKLTFTEKGLPELFEKALNSGIKFSSEYVTADTYIVAVPTPHDTVNKKVKADYVVSAVESVIKVCPDNATVVIESTVSPGTIDKYIRPVVIKAMNETGKKINLAHAPERIIPGNMVYELQNNSHTIGSDDRETGEKVKSLYATFCQGEIVLTDIRTAEMTKVVENTFRDINIAFANELAKICREDGMDVHEIISIANRHPRVNILQPGPGVGGHCISVDPWFLVGDYPQLTNLIRTAREVNESMPSFVFERILKIMDNHGISDISEVGIYGLTYKENIDDTRESPSLKLAELSASKGHFKYYDPFVTEDILPCQYHSLDSFLADTKLIVLMIGHNEIRTFSDKLKNHIVFDTRNIKEVTADYSL